MTKQDQVPVLKKYQIYDKQKAVISLINLLNAQSNFVSSVELTQFSKSVENRFASILNQIDQRNKKMK